MKILKSKIEEYGSKNFLLFYRSIYEESRHLDTILPNFKAITLYTLNIDENIFF